MIYKIFQDSIEPYDISGDYISVTGTQNLSKECEYMKKYDEILQYYDDLSRFALSKCTSQTDAEDLVSETMLAAFTYLQSGGIIEHPKTWLWSTFMHKWNSALRRQYRTPVTVCIDSLYDLTDDDISEDSLFLSDGGMTTESYLQTDEGAYVRKTLTYLAKTSREVLIRYYYNGESVSTIAKALGIPEGTVKSRLSTGRDQMKKGLVNVKNKKNHIPGVLNFSWSGREGRNFTPGSLVWGDLIAQNLLILAYEKPVSMRELAEMIGIPTVYIEPITQKLVDGELMVHTENDKYYTDFIIYKPEDSLNTFDAQLGFVKEHFEQIWTPIAEMLEKIHAIPYVKTLRPRQIQKLDRFAVHYAAQRFILSAPILGLPSPEPQRRDGGAWSGQGWYVPAEYDNPKNKEAGAYILNGGHRTNGHKVDFHGTTYLNLHEFDTFMWDHPNRFAIVGMDLYFNHIHKLLWCIHRGINPEKTDIPNTLIEKIPSLIDNTGLFTRENGTLQVDIPVMEKSVYAEINRLVQETKIRIFEAVGKEYEALLKKSAVRIPSHLKSVPTSKLYRLANLYIEMAIVREAHARGLHMQGVNYCCPPVVLVYEEKQ